MTKLIKPVKRKTHIQHFNDSGPVTVTLLPGDGNGHPDVIRFQRHKSRKFYDLPLEHVYNEAIRATVKSQRATRRSRLVSRGLLSLEGK